MKKTITFFVALMTIATIGMAQSAFPSKAMTLSGSGSVGKNNTSYFAASVGSINRVVGSLYIQPRVSFLLADEITAFNLGIAPTVPIKTWKSCSLYAATEVSVAFGKNMDAYVQVSPELGTLCSVGKNAFVLTRLNYDIRDNVNRNVNFSFGVGFKL